MVVQHNTSAMTANRYYGINNSALGKSLEKLSSGYAINRAGDNAAGLAVSEKMRAQIAGLTQASKNAQDGISMVQTYEGALQETDSILQRMRTIAVQSANGSYQNDVDRDALQLEFDQLNDELNQIADTDFNGVVALNGGIMADGTVVNNTTKVAERPTVNDVNATPNATFTYSSSANGTVDGAANGSLTVNGVALKLNKGQGSVTLGNSSSGITSYTANVGVNNGAVSGTVSVKETYAAENASNITIHGQTFSIDSTGLRDSNGDSVSTIDGLSVKANRDTTTGNILSFELNGKYLVEDNVVRTDRSFTSSASSGEIKNSDTASTANKNTFSASGTSIAFADAENSIPFASGTLSVNGASINISNQTGGGITTVGKVKYEVSGFSANEASGKVSATVTATGTGAIAANTKEQNVLTSVSDASVVGTGTKYLSTDDNAKFTFKDTFSNKDVTITVSTEGDGDTQGTQLKISDGVRTFDWSDGKTILLDKNGALTDDEAEAVSKFELKTAVSVQDTASQAQGKLNVSNSDPDDPDFKVSRYVYSDDGMGKGVKVYTSVDGTNALAVDGDNKADIDANNDVNLGNGLKFTMSDKKLSGTNVINDSLDTVEIGSFKISQGVSTSDAYNHGSANLTFADNMTLQVGARSKDAVTFNFSYTTNGIGNLKSDLNASARGLGTDQVSVKTQEDANAAIDQIDNAINKISMIRGTFGAIQNRLEHKINNIDTNAENLTAAESRIRDTQMDQEMMKFTSAQILSQASQSMLAQANSLPQGVLQLLG